MENYNKYKMISKEMLLAIGKRKNLINKGHIEKSYFQDLFLFNLFKKTNKLIFKGGTALYKLYGLPRFSEDLDFSLLESIDFNSTKKVIRETIKNNDYFKIKSEKKTKNSFLIKIECKVILTGYNSLRIDINFKNKIISGFDVKNYTPEYIDINPFSLRVLKLEEIISEKIHSILVRKKARDLFDLFFLLRISKMDKILTKEKLKVFNMEYDVKLLEKNINEIKDSWDKELKPFILSELPSFDTVKEFVLPKL